MTIIKIFSPELAQNINCNDENANAQLCEYEEYITLWLWAYKKLLNTS
jgi:hypothetical protein